MSQYNGVDLPAATPRVESVAQNPEANVDLASVAPVPPTLPPPPPGPDVAAIEAISLETDMSVVRTYDRYWIDRRSVQYTSGFKKEYDFKLKKAIRTNKVSSAIPLILRDMGPPAGSVFDPNIVWEKEKPAYLAGLKGETASSSASSAALPSQHQKQPKAKKKGGHKKATKAELIAQNSKRLEKKNHGKDAEKMSNNNCLESLQKSTVETDSGRLQRMLKMLHIAVTDFKGGSTGEEEIFDILWSLESINAFALADEELVKDKAQRKLDKKEKKGKEGASKKESKSSKKSPVTLSENAQVLKSLYDSYDYKDSLKFARKLLQNHDSIVEFQFLQMHDRLPPLSKYNRKFKLEEWQCQVLTAIDEKQSTIVCAPTSSGKTLLSTFTCANINHNETVLFVLPSEVLVWQVAATYYQFFEGNVTLCTDSIVFQDQGGKAQVYIGTPRALEIALTKARGIAGQEMAGEREFMILDGGFSFAYLVLDEVHTLNGPEGDALQRIIRATNCPVLALSATIGNAVQLRNWFQLVRDEHLGMIEGEGPGKRDEVLGVEHFARFINLQRYVVVKEQDSSYALKKLHPVAAMTTSRLLENKSLISALSMTPVDLISLYERMKKYPGLLTDGDSPENFFFAKDKDASNKSKQITLPQTKLYENRLKALLMEFAASDPDKYEELRSSFDPPPLEKIDSLEITDQLYGVVTELKNKNLLPAVAFQLSTFGAFQMFKTLLKSLEVAQNVKYPDHRNELRKKAQEKSLMRKIAEGKAEKANKKDGEDDAQAGFDEADMSLEDIYQPHPQFVLSPANSHLKLQEIEDLRGVMEKAGEKLDINHALMRGLRRGIAIYTNEVGFACYRRQVQILAQKGKLAVVFSDEALAYGVNMPFRSCVFCGDMGPALTPLIAQQMQGRAGRRGMDVQGNIVYLGMEWGVIENLMLGQISQVTGSNPHYPLLALQRALAMANDPNDPNFIHGKEVDLETLTQKERDDRRKWAKMSNSFEHALVQMTKSQNCVPTVKEENMVQMTNAPLSSFCGIETTPNYYEVSKEIIRQLEYVDIDMQLTADHNVLSMVWELSIEYTAECVNLAASLPSLYRHFVANQRASWLNIGDQNAFMAAILQIVDRIPCAEGDVSLQRYLKVEVEAGSGKLVDESSKDLFIDVHTDICLLRDKVAAFTLPVSSSSHAEEEKQKLILPCLESNGSEIGVPLDSGVYELLQTKKKGFSEDVSVARRNELKKRLFTFGEILRVFNNNIQQPHSKYRELAAYSNKCFTAVRYSLMDILTQLTNQADECD